ncbi:MAG: hypothetical protein ACD_9C00205G0003 [uncultured bacterium]|nr:MAG: hypothetical protein ACD_9C00205G0003 [uncultured bacterium]
MAEENINQGETEEPKKEESPKSENETKKEQENKAENAEKDNKLWAVLSYLGVLVIIPLLAKKESKFVQFHVKQGLVLLVGWVLSWLPFGPIIAIIVFVFSIMGIINVLSGEMKKLPLVGDLAEKINL